MTNEEIQLQQLKQLKVIANTYQVHRVVSRGCLTGIFSAVGTTIGFAIVLALAASFISTIKDWPIIDSILAETKIDVLIENQISNLSGIDNQETVKPIENSPKPEIKFNDNKIPLQFLPPQYLQYQASSRVNEQDADYHIIYEGSGPLSGLTVYINETPVTSTTDSDQKTFAVVVSGVNNEFTGYYPHIKIDEIQTNGPVFMYQTKFANTSITLIGVANEETPGVGREIFRQVVETIQFK
jgi:hypothetical protein